MTNIINLSKVIYIHKQMVTQRVIKENLMYTLVVKNLKHILMEQIIVMLELNIIPLIIKKNMDLIMIMIGGINLNFKKKHNNKQIITQMLKLMVMRIHHLLLKTMILKVQLMVMIFLNQKLILIRKNHLKIILNKVKKVFTVIKDKIY